jgi:zinc protease
MRWVGCLLLVGCASGAAVDHAPRVAAPRARPPVPASLVVPPMDLGPRARFVLPNGLSVVVVERHRTPLVSVRLVLDGGSADEPLRQAGATALAAGLLAESHERDAAGRPLVGEKSLRRQLVELGASYRSSVTHDATVLGLDGYARDLDVYLAKLGDAVIRPRAGEGAFAHHRTSMLDALEELEQGDDEVLGLVLAQAAFGEGHVYARPVNGTHESLEALSLDEVRARQKVLLAPGRATVVVVGDVDAARAAGLVRRHFEAWAAPSRAAAAHAAPVSPPLPSARRSVQLIARAPASTTQVCATRPLGDVPLDDAAVEVLVHILGEGVDSRLAVLRERYGWTYAPWAQLARKKHGRGLVLCVRLEAAHAGEGLGVLWQTLAELRTGGPTPEETARARKVLASRAEASADDVAGATSRAVARLVLGAADESLPARLSTVTPEQVRSVGQSVLDPSLLQLVVLGDPGVARAAIAPHALGPVRALRLAELGAPQLVAAPSPRAVEAVVDPLEGTGHDFEIEAALSDGGTTTVHLRVSDRTRRELLSDTYALLGVRGAVATPELLKVERVEGEPPVFVVRVRFRGGLKGEVVVRRASGGTTAPAAIDRH